MTPSLASMLTLLRDTITGPREGARAVMAMNLPRATLWQVLAAVVVVSVLLSQVGQAVVPTGGEALMPMFLSNPLLTAVVQGALLVVMTAAVFQIGRAFGGTGDFDDALALITWLQVVMVCLQLLQTAALLILPPLAGIIGVVGICLFFWLLTHFVAVLHAFRSLGQVFLMILGAMIGVIVALSLVLTVLGLSFEGGM